MRHLGIEAALRELLRDVVRDELRHFREEMLEAFASKTGRLRRPNQIPTSS